MEIDRNDNYSEYVKETVKQFGVLSDQIVALVVEGDSEQIMWQPDLNGVRMWHIPEFETYIFSSVDRIQGIGSGHIGFQRCYGAQFSDSSLTEFSPDAYDSYVDRLYIGIHTDMPTQGMDILRPQTQYEFDRNGIIHKYAWVNSSESRPSRRTFGSVKQVSSELHLREFELVGFALQQLHRRVKGDERCVRKK